MILADDVEYDERCVSDKWLVNQMIKVMDLIIERERGDKNKRGK